MSVSNMRFIAIFFRDKVISWYCGVARYDVISLYRDIVARYDVITLFRDNALIFNPLLTYVC